MVRLILLQDYKWVFRMLIEPWRIYFNCIVYHEVIFGFLNRIMSNYCTSSWNSNRKPSTSGQSDEKILNLQRISMIRDNIATSETKNIFHNCQHNHMKPSKIWLRINLQPQRQQINKENLIASNSCAKFLLQQNFMIQLFLATCMQTVVRRK